jgi:shikimate kinase
MGNLIFSLVGPKHCGKSEIGRKCAGKSGGFFIDVDELIIEQNGRTPRELYTDGVFQEAETRAVCEALARSGESAVPALVAAGGGVIDNEEAFALLRAASRVVYLDVTPDTAWARIEAAQKNGGGLPPFLNTGNPRNSHRKLHTRRAAAYRKAAHHIIAAGDKSIEALCEELRAYMTEQCGSGYGVG